MILATITIVLVIDQIVIVGQEAYQGDALVNQTED